MSQRNGWLLFRLNFAVACSHKGQCRSLPLAQSFCDDDQVF